MSSTPLPNWLKKKTTEINRSGKLILSKEWYFEAKSLSLRKFSPFLSKIRVLDLSFTAIDDISEFPKFPSLKTFIANNSNIKNFSNFLSIKGVSSVSLIGTPVSLEETYSVSIAALLSPEIQKLDGKKLQKSAIEVAEMMLPCVSKLLNSGWIMPHPIPNEQEIAEECARRGIEIDSNCESEIFSISDDECNAAAMSDRDIELAKGISDVLIESGIDVRPDDYNGLLKAIEDILPLY